MTVHLATDHCGVSIDVHTSLKNHSLAAEFVELNIKIDICFRPLDECTAHCLKSLNELPWNTTDNKLILKSIDTDRRYITNGSHTSEETISLDDGSLRTLTRCCNGGNKACRTATHDNYVILSYDWSDASDLSCFFICNRT